jgi:hypothetical protein
VSEVFVAPLGNATSGAGRTGEPPPEILRRDRAATVERLVTGLLVVMMIASGFVNVAAIRPPFMGAHDLGYPAYVPPMLGVAKLMGVATFFTRRAPTLREWAYAGFVFELLGASFSHLLAGNGVVHALPPLVDLAVVLASYGCWHRRLAPRAGLGVAHA